MSHIVAIMPCRNSGWVIGLTARALLMFCDEVVILNHASTDNTVEVLRDLVADGELGYRVTYLYEPDPCWQEMQHRQRLLQSARDLKATHVVIVDDDEVVSGNLLPNIRQMVESTPRGSVLQLPWVQLKGSTQTYISSGLWSQQCASTAFPDDPAYHWADRNGYCHHHRHPMGKLLNIHMPMGRNVKAGGTAHLQMASDNRLRWKQYLYKLSERKRWPNRKTAAELNTMYDPTVNSTGELSPVPAEWFAPYAHIMDHLHVDAEPWQKSEALRMLAEDARLADGLTTYGLEL